METHAVDKLRGIIERLTRPDGCPWDREQTPESLADYFIEESHELVDAIRSGNAEEVCGEMGDLVFLLLFLAHLYEKKNAFTLDDVLEGNAAKMIRRHPHVFADATFENREAQLRAWEQIKRAEHPDAAGQPRAVFDSLPRALPPLIRAYRIHSKAARIGFTWEEDQEVEQQVEAEWLEWLDAAAGDDKQALTHELGDLLFSLVELGRRRGIKANEALDLATRRFLRRFSAMEALAAARGQDFAALSLDDKDELWNEVKAAENPDAALEEKPEA